MGESTVVLLFVCAVAAGYLCAVARRRLRHESGLHREGSMWL